MIQRESHLEQLRILKDVSLIKVVTGIRRCEKSTLFRLFEQELLDSGISEKRIQHYNLEDPDHTTFLDWKSFYDFIKINLVTDEMNYIFLDEIQMLDNFERLLNGLHILDKVDIYVTGSNAYLLSGELATILTGRAITINMYPFSFTEYLEYMEISIPEESNLIDYIQTGGLPQALELKKLNFDLYSTYLKDLFTTILEKDIKTRNKLYSEKSFDDLTRFLADSIGSSVSPSSISKTLKGNKVNIDDKTISRYLSILNDSFMFYSA